METTTHGDVTVTIKRDSFCDSPLEDRDDDIIFATWERNSIFNDRKFRPFDEPEDAAPYADANGYLIFPLFKYEHGNVQYDITAFSCRWDSGQVGFFLVKEGCFTDPEKFARQWLDTMSDWCNGEVYGYVITENATGDVLDSCWRFFGFDSVTEAAGEALEWAQEQAAKNKAERERSAALVEGAWVETQGC